jgi:hypothetical protein
MTTPLPLAGGAVKKTDKGALWKITKWGTALTAGIAFRLVEYRQRLSELSISGWMEVQ